MPRNAPNGSSRLERGTAMVLRSFIFWLASYIVCRLLFPFAVLEVRLADLTVGQFLMAMLQVLSATTGAAYLLLKGLRHPPLAKRDRAWCERWSAIGFGVLALLIGSVLLGLLERKGIVVPWVRWIAIGVLSLLY